MILSIADSVKNAIELGIDLLRDGAGIDVTAITFIVQICATLVLFLFVRFFFWNKVTEMIDKRRENIQKDIDSKDEALRELEEAREEASFIISSAKKEADLIVEKAKTNSKTEADTIMKRALQEIEVKQKASVEQIKNDREKMEESLRDEIITVAYALAEKITEKEIDQSKNEDLVNDFLKEVGK
ncbi:MAG: F0F1 ATP synthase subunit B [Bacilli bacterium]|nr:F0F1 ATP synthase subunit B [Bacilli bacterium]